MKDNVSINVISKDIALKFCELCNWAYECWRTHKRLFDDNTSPNVTIGKAAYFTSRLSKITQEYSLLQISKLHDPAIQQNTLNLTIDYIVRFGDWRDENAHIINLKKKLTKLWEDLNLKTARNKIIAHNDFEILMKDTIEGAFPQGLDEQYFATLQEFANAVHNKWACSPYPFNNIAEADVEEFLAVLTRA